MSPGVVGLFIGGSASRMQGFPKGLLKGPQGLCILEQHCHMAAQLGWQTVLLGTHPAYANFAKARNIQCLADLPSGIGPLGGFASLLRFAGRRFCIALACDMPHVAFEDLQALALSPSNAAALVPRRRYWEPLFARYNADKARPALEAFLEAGGRSFQAFLDGLGPDIFCPTTPQTLDDWDSFEDMNVAENNK